MWAGATWMSLLATAGVGAVLGYGLAITRVSRSQWTPIPSPFLSIAGEADDTDEYEDAKMILVVRQDLKMGKGKIAAQCCHAAVGVVMDLCESEEGHRLMTQWEANGATKVAVKADTEATLLEVEQKCMDAGIPCFMVIDAGRTQIAPNSRTVLAVGPAPSELVDTVTGDLKLL